MNKFIRIMAIVSTALVALSLLLILVSVLFQPLLFRVLYGYEDVTFVFPWVAFLNWVLRFVCIALLIICCGEKKGGIWLELLVFFTMLLIIPMLTTVGSLLFNDWLLDVKGVEYYSLYNHATNIAGECALPAGWGNSLAYVTCGMSIVYKMMSKASDKAAEQTLRAEEPEVV